ncbi:CLUMA_CG000752, isoform A [Clunio marinus]|uniref:CLUMA_CG000752, isoform A n=1 Tax=Clunio marinus TaxID=568069 RepID=A0A1J1HGD0_9DIPT|nr:CLUMA_CG000752, isoform A [Clunio marinus]
MPKGIFYSIESEESSRASKQNCHFILMVENIVTLLNLRVEYLFYGKYLALFIALFIALTFVHCNVNSHENRLPQGEYEMSFAFACTLNSVQLLISRYDDASSALIFN